MLTLKNRTAVISGATGHIGREAVRELTKAGMNVVMVTHNMTDAQSLIDEVANNDGSCIALSNEHGDGAVFQEVFERFGSVDVVIPNQGEADISKPLEEITVEELDHKIHHQVGISFEMVKGALPYLRKSAAPRIILIGSAGAEKGIPEEGLLDCVARGGVISLTRFLAAVLAKDRITVNCIARSGLENDHPVSVEKGELDNMDLIPGIPLQRNGTPKEFAAAVAYLASEEAGFVTGEILQLNGGMAIGS